MTHDLIMISLLLFAGGKRKALWAETAASLIAVDTLVAMI